MILLFLFLIPFLFYGIKIYRDIFIPFADPYLKKHGRLFTFLLVILPIWLSSFYLTFSIGTIDAFPSSIALVVRSIGCVGLVCSIIITSFWIKTDFKDKSDKEYSLDLKNTTSFNKNKEDVENGKANFSIFLKNSNLWMKFLNDERSKPYFDETGKLLPNLSVNDSTIIASLIYKLKKYNLFNENYNTKMLNEIAGVSFGIRSAVGRAHLIDHKLFNWVSEL